MLFDKVQRLPAPGDPLELVFLIVWKMKQQIEFQKARVATQALMSQKGAEEKNIQKAFDDLKEAFFPYDKNEKASETKKMKQVMLREMSRGPLSVTVTEDPNRKKMQSKLARGDQEMSRKLRMQESGQLTKIDSLTRAQTRNRPSAL